MKRILLVALSILAFHTTGAQSGADLVILNGKIWTVNQKQPEAEAVACIGGRIVAVGTTNEINAWVGGEPVSSIWR
jgi:predicted amidohydrolase YtcJ